MIKEDWKDIPGFEGRFQISTTGRVKSLKRQCNNQNAKPYWIQEKILTQWTDKLGYKRLSLFVDGQRHARLVHRLVALAFIPNPENKPQINHKDCNPSNNNVDNLEWCTNKENAVHYYSNFAIPRPGSRSGEKCPTAKLTWQDVSVIRSSTLSTKELAAQFNCSHTNIRDIIKNKIWKREALQVIKNELYGKYEL